MDDFNKRFWDTFEQMQEDFDRFFDHYARAKHPSVVAYRTRWSPPCNVYDDGDSIRVLVEIAGMRRDALDVRIDDGRLLLRGSRSEIGPPARCNLRQMEIEFGEFELDIPLDVPVDAEAAQAWYQDGFLHVVLPKIAVAKPRRITITVPEREK
ncbi:MAG TPA: Hsp20/alpha crystallin family protein [Armatimonadota bacterium]|nr:Hsp20/alpha crystallin family protein [Armatimonadota bacterium]